MTFWLINLPLYVVFLAGGLGLPGVVLWQRDPLDWSGVALYLAASVLLLLATFVMCLLLARLVFPGYWWLGQVEGKDVFAFDGVYFLGLRLTRVPTRLQRLLFGVDEQMRVWDLLFGLMFVVMLVPHTMGFLTAHRYLDQQLPNPVKFAESMHEPMLSGLPVMQEWGSRWSSAPTFGEQVEAARNGLQNKELPGIADRFRLAQLYLLDAFTLRKSVRDPYYDTPGEHVYFNRGQAARAVDNLRFLVELPELQRVSWSGGALALIGFFHLSDHNFQEAQKVLEQAVAELGEGDESEISRYQVLLLAAQSALMNGDEAGAMAHVDQILVDERLPNQAYALAMELYAEALRLSGRYSQVPELLGKALELYKLEQDRGGIARVHLRLAALALDEGRLKEAREELSIASSLAHGLGDTFTLNMVERLALSFGKSA